MADDTNKLTADYLESSRGMQRRVRNIFLGSVALSVGLLAIYAFLPHGEGPLSRIVRVAFPPLLLWSFTIAGYAFHLLSSLTNQARRFVEQYAVADSATGVKSLSYMRSLLQKEYETASQTGRSSSVLYVDLENLDRVNSDFGHAVGDVVLRNLAGRIEAAVSEQGVVGRVAGDEFLVVLPGTSSKKAKSVAEAIERSVEQYRLDLGKNRHVDFVRCRIGIVGCQADGEFADEIIGLAQKASHKPGRMSQLDR